MVEINRLEDLTKLGTLTKDLLILSTDGIVKFTGPIKIPYSIKITGDTVFTSTQMANEVTFTGRKSVFSSAASGNSLSLKNINLRGDIPLFDIKQNTISRLIIDGVSADVPSLGSANFKTLHLTDFRGANPNQRPLEIGSCNAIIAMSVRSSSINPLLDIDETKTVRDHITIHDFRDTRSGGFISVGARELDETYMLANIPKRGIMVKRITNQPFELLRVIQEGCYTIPDINAVRKYFG